MLIRAGLDFSGEAMLPTVLADGVLAECGLRAGAVLGVAPVGIDLTNGCHGMAHSVDTCALADAPVRAACLVLACSTWRCSR